MICLKCSPSPFSTTQSNPSSMASILDLSYLKCPRIHSSLTYPTHSGKRLEPLASCHPDIFCKTHRCEKFSPLMSCCEKKKNTARYLYFVATEIWRYWLLRKWCFNIYTVKTLKIGTPEIITIIVLQMEQLDFTVQYCVQKMQTE